MTDNREQAGTIFTVTFHAPAGGAGIHALRALLKTALRRFGLRCTDIREERAPAPDTSTRIADAFDELRHDVRNRLRERSS